MARPPTRLDELPGERDLGGLSGRIVGRGPRLVLFHGGPGLDHHLLLPLALELSNCCEVVLPDLPGHGASGPHGRRPDLDEIVRETADWARALDPPPALIAGHSLGAHLVLRFLADRELKPKAALLLAPPGPEPRGSEDRLQHAREDERRLRQALIALLREESDGPLSAEAVEAVERSRLRSPIAHANLLSQLRRRLTRPPSWIPFRGPVLVLTGEHDGIAPPENAGSLAGALPDGRLVVLPGRGHWCVATEPARVAEAVRGFLSGAGLLER